MSRRSFVASLLLASLLGACSDDSAEPSNPNTPSDAGTSGDAGTPDAGPSVGLVINEVVASGDPDWFELYNGGGQPVDLSGVTFTDDPTTPTKGRFPAGTTLGPRSFLRVDVGDTQTGFSLGADEELALFSATGARLDSVDWNDGDSPKGKSFGRLPDGSGAFQTLNTPTSGVPNLGNGVCGNGSTERDEACEGSDLRGATCASQGYASGTLSCSTSCQLDTQKCVAATSDVVINELTSAGDDRIELYNRGSGAVDLTGWYVADIDYDPATGLPADKRFVLSSSLASKGYRVLVKGTDHTFGLGKSGTLRLFNKSNQRVDLATWTTGTAEPSFCRRPNGTGDFASCSAASFGATNP